MTAMPAIHLRNVPAEVHEALRERAARNGRSLNGEAVAILAHAVRSDRDPEEAIRALDRLRAATKRPTGEFAPEAIIRRYRDGR
jgi:plasmid stability protein